MDEDENSPVNLDGLLIPPGKEDKEGGSSGNDKPSGTICVSNLEKLIAPLSSSSAAPITLKYGDTLAKPEVQKWADPVLDALRELHHPVI